MRGERPPPGARNGLASGSSPHARGTHPARHVRRAAGRFIPACAGNAIGGHRRFRPDAVHPRMRGERRSALAMARAAAGSSPHARGTRPLGLLQWQGLRFIPACAGNAVFRGNPSVNDAVHPRMRGERSFAGQCGYRRYGSSPHARGTQRIVHRHGLRKRFIPACAGNAAVKTDTWPIAAVHPRMRGERNQDPRATRPPAGSSPHARGTPERPSLVGAQRRFIPACAGNAILPITRW